MRPWSDKRFFSRRFAAAALAICLSLCLCLPVSVAAPAHRVGVALPSFRENRWAYDLQALREQSELQGVSILVRFAGNNQEQQNLQVKEMVNLGIDALLLVPSDAEAAAPAVEYAKSRGVLVFSYDRLAFHCSPDAYVTFEQTRVGELQGRFLAEHAPKGNYVLLYGAKEDGNSAQFRDGAMKYLGPLIARGDIHVVLEGEAKGWKPEEAKRLMLLALEKTTDIQAVLAPSDLIAAAVVEALQTRNLAGKTLVTGQDATVEAQDLIHRGLQHMTVQKDTNLLAAKALRVAAAYLRGDPPRPDGSVSAFGRTVPVYYIPVAFIDRTSLPALLRRGDSPR